MNYKKRLLAGVAALLLGMVGMAHASLTHIGFALYDDGIGNIGAYKMIYDDDSPLGPITWLDYSRGVDYCPNQRDWAASLNNPGELQYYFLDGITMDWAGEDWRLPSAGNNPKIKYYQTGSEIGHLFYEELGLVDSYPVGGYTTTAELNAGEFNNLIASWYWSGTEYYSTNLWGYFWGFDMDGSGQGIAYMTHNGYGLAVRSGEVTTTPAPIPGASLLLGSGLVGLGLRRGKRTTRSKTRSPHPDTFNSKSVTT